MWILDMRLLSVGIHEIGVIANIAAVNRLKIMKLLSTSLLAATTSLLALSTSHAATVTAAGTLTNLTPPRLDPSGTVLKTTKPSVPTPALSRSATSVPTALPGGVRFVRVPAAVTVAA